MTHFAKPTKYSTDYIIRQKDHLNDRTVETILKKNEDLFIFLLSFLLDIGMAYILFFVLRIGNSDALSRTANAYYVLYSRDPHLAAIGFIWPPLPSILQLPLLPITKALNIIPFTGNIVSALSGAACLVMMNKLLINMNVTTPIRWILVALLQFHPYTWYLFSAGMSEAVFLFFILTTLFGLSILPESMRSWVIVGFSLAAAFFTRYETLAMIVGVVLAVFIIMWEIDSEWKAKSEGLLIAILLPPFYGIALWIFFNWTLMSDPFYFLHSQFSLSNAADIAKIAGVSHPYYRGWENLLESFRIGITRSYQQCIAYPVLGIFAFISILQHQDRKGMGMFLAMISITAFTVLQVFQGSLASWMRYWFYAAPFLLVMAGIIQKNLIYKWRFLFNLLVIALFIASTPLLLNSMHNSQMGSDEQRLSALILDPEKEVALREKDGFWVYLNDAPIVAEAVDNFSEDGLVLVDSNSSFSVIMESGYPKRLVSSNDSDYFTVLNDPIGKATFILVLDPAAVGIQNTINIAYPSLFEKGADWATLVWDSGNQTHNHWRIYQVHSIE